MSEQLVLGSEHGSEDDFDDEETFIQLAAQDGADLPDEYRSYIPQEYVEAVFGPRGSGKDIYLTRSLMFALDKGYPVFTNAILHPDRFDITNKPHDIDIEYLLRFDPSLTGGVIGISEINTWVKKKRPMYTSNILVGDFLMQLRKRNLRVIVTTQFDYLPGEMADQVDLEVQARDLFWTEWGREARLAKGTTFSYVFTDISGIFTGWKGNQWQWGLRNAQKIWKGFETDQIFDPLQWAHRTIIKGGERVLDMNQGRMYGVGERESEIQQKAEVEYHQLQELYREWGYEGIQFAQKKGLILATSEGEIHISDTKLRRQRTSGQDDDKEIAGQLYDHLLETINSTKGHLARFIKGGKVIVLRTPVMPITKGTNEN